MFNSLNIDMAQNSKDLKYIYINVNFQVPYSLNFDQYSDSSVSWW